MLGEGEKKERKSGVARKELDEMVGLDSVKTVIHLLRMEKFTISMGKR